jgi:hypothetical protein
MGLPQFRFTLKHKLQTENLEFSNNSFDVSISGWSQISSGSDIAFTWAATSSARASGAAPDTTAIGQQRSDNPSEGWPPGDYRVSISATNNSTGGIAPLQSVLQIYGSDNGTSLNTSVSYTGNGYWNVGAGKVTNVVAFTITDYQQYLFFKFQKAGPGAGYNVDFRIDVIEIIYANVIFSRKSISEPDGWKDAKLIFERHPEFHSLVEYFESSFIFYGNNGIDDGGIDYIKNVERTYGVDANILMLAEITFDQITYETVFEGLLDLSDLKEVVDNKMDIPVIRDTMWTKFIARRDTPVDLRSTVDLDGNPVDAVTPVDINLTSQVVRQKYQATQEQFVTQSYTIPNNQYGGLDFANEVFSEIDDKFSIPRIDNPTLPGALFTMEYAGNYSFDIKVVTATGVILGSSTNALLKVRLRVNGADIATLTQTVTIAGPESYTTHTYTGSLSLLKGDNVYLYFINNGIGSDYSFVWFANVLHDSHLNVTGDTIFPSSTAESFLLHDAFAGVLQRIIGRNCFYSEILGSPYTFMRSYLDSGCYWGNAILRGLQLRTYTLSEKPFSISFNDLWEGANPVFNLSLMYDTVSGEDVIRIEDKAFQYPDTEPVLQVANIRTIERGYDKESIFKKIQIGYNKWQSEDISSIDDPQTKRTYATRFEKTGKDINIESKFVAASIAFEVTRRKSIKKTEDYKFDNDTFMLALNTTQVSPDRYTPELAENFNSISGLTRSETRYNIVHSAGRMFLRWANFFGGCLQKYTSSSYRFVSGEGNFDMTSDYNCSTGQECLAVLCDSFSEKQDISLGSPSNYNSVFKFFHLPTLINIDEIDFSWDDALLVRGDRTLPISISQIDSDFKRLSISKIEYLLCYSKAKIMGWPAITNGEAVDIDIRIIKSINPPPPGGWVLLPPVDPSGCNTLFYEAYFTSNLEGWVSDGGYGHTSFYT